MHTFDSDFAPTHAAHVSAPRDSMALFALRCVLFALPLVVFAACVELRLRKLDNTYTVQRRQFESGLDHFEVLVTGASGAANGVDPSRWGVSGYNLANGSQSIHYDIGIISRYLDRLPRLRLVIFAVPFWYLSYELKSNPEAWRQHFYTVFWGVPPEVESHQWITIADHSFIALYTPLTAVEYFFRGGPLGLADGVRASGWQPATALTPQEHAVEVGPRWTRTRVDARREQISLDSQRKNLAEFEAFASRLRANGIRIAIVWTPETGEYAANFGAAAHAAQRALVDALVSRDGVRFVDYATDARFVSEDFSNADHLNVAGAEKFSRILANEVVSPELADQR